VGASKPPNRWPAERFTQLVRALRERDSAPLCLCGGPEDRLLFAPVLEAVRGMAGVRDLVGRSSLPELVALERRARLFVGCDTGPMHIAAALGTPVVALFGPADPRRTGPRGAGHRVVRAADGAMASVSSEQVLAAVLEALSRSA
jgi:ADP-heptose:LPS heptosyltransferase